MYLADYHVHSTCSQDGRQTMAQAAQAVERYTGQVTPRERILDVTERLSRREQNLSLIHI